MLLAYAYWLIWLVFFVQWVFNLTTSKPLSDIEQWQKLLGEYINLNSRADYERHIEKCRELLSRTKEPLIKETMPDHIKSCKDIMRLY